MLVNFAAHTHTYTYTYIHTYTHTYTHIYIIYTCILYIHTKMYTRYTCIHILDQHNVTRTDTKATAQTLRSLAHRHHTQNTRESRFTACTEWSVYGPRTQCPVPVGYAAEANRFAHSLSDHSQSELTLSANLRRPVLHDGARLPNGHWHPAEAGRRPPLLRSRRTGRGRATIEDVR